MPSALCRRSCMYVRTRLPGTLQPGCKVRLDPLCFLHVLASWCALCQEALRTLVQRVAAKNPVNPVPIQDRLQPAAKVNAKLCDAVQADTTLAAPCSLGLRAGEREGATIVALALPSSRYHRLQLLRPPAPAQSRSDSRFLHWIHCRFSLLACGDLGFSQPLTKHGAHAASLEAYGVRWRRGVCIA